MWPTVRWRTGPVWCHAAMKTTQSNLGLGAREPGLVPMQEADFWTFLQRRMQRVIGHLELKTAPRCLHSSPKYPKSITTLRHIATTHTSGFNEIQAPVFSYSCEFVYSRSCHRVSCVCCCDLLLCVYFISLPYSDLRL
jgi:hypothetical protein